MLPCNSEHKQGLAQFTMVQHPSPIESHQSWGQWTIMRNTKINVCSHLPFCNINLPYPWFEPGAVSPLGGGGQFKHVEKNIYINDMRLHDSFRNDTLLSGNVACQPPLCQKSLFLFPLIQTAFGHKRKQISITFGATQLIKQKWHLTGPRKFTRNRQSHHICSHGRFHRHLPVNRIAKQSSHLSPELAWPLSNDTQWSQSVQRRKKGLPIKICVCFVSKKNFTSIQYKITACCHCWSHLC